MASPRKPEGLPTSSPATQLQCSDFNTSSDDSAMAETDSETFEPPREPPSILNFEQISHLAQQGWLQIQLPAGLESQLQKLSAKAAIFFDLDFEAKENLYPSSKGTECGFYHIKEEKEYVTFRHEVHAHSELEQIVRSSWRAAAQLLHRIICDISRAGYYDPTAWNSLVENALELPKNDGKLDTNITLMRLFRYYATTGHALEHVDVGFLTLCVGDGGCGLQVWDRMQHPAQWTDVVGPVVLVGDMTRAMLGNRVRAGLHRVVGNPNGRSSIVLALRPCLEGSIDLSHFGGEGVVQTRDYFYKIKGRKYNINAKKDIRDQQQRDQEERMQQHQRTASSSKPTET